jgi:hypothetical protein
MGGARPKASMSFQSNLPGASSPIPSGWRGAGKVFAERKKTDIARVAAPAAL